MDCWYYTSLLAYKLSMEVGDGLGDCPTEHLCQMWSGDYASQLLVNRAQCFKENDGDATEYMLINVSERSQGQDRRGLWVRLEQNATSGLFIPTVQQS